MLRVEYFFQSGSYVWLLNNVKKNCKISKERYIPKASWLENCQQ